MIGLLERFDLRARLGWVLASLGDSALDFNLFFERAPS
jgi:hypothetical protein